MGGSVWDFCANAEEQVLYSARKTKWGYAILYKNEARWVYGHQKPGEGTNEQTKVKVVCDRSPHRSTAR